MNYLVTGDHPIFKRPDKTFTDGEEAIAYAGELEAYNYENIKITEGKKVKIVEEMPESGQFVAINDSGPYLIGITLWWDDGQLMAYNVGEKRFFECRLDPNWATKYIVKD